MYVIINNLYSSFSQLNLYMENLQIKANAVITKVTFTELRLRLINRAVSNIYLTLML